MPRKSPPKYRHYKPKDLAVVRIDGKDHYLGKYDSPESREKYHRLISEWLSAKGTKASPSPASSDSCLTINQVLLRYNAFVEQYYVREGEPTARNPFG